MKFKTFIFVFFTLLFTSGSFADATQYPPATLSGPRDSFNYFLKTMKGHKLGDQEAIDLALKALSLEHFSPESRIASGRLAAQRLVNTLDRLEFIDVSHIPDTVDSDQWVYRQQNVNVSGINHQVIIALAKQKDGKWRFSKETIDTIPYFYQSVAKKSVAVGVVRLVTWKSKIKSLFPHWTSERVFFLMNGQWLAIFFVIFIAFVIERLTRIYGIHIAGKFLKRTRMILTPEDKKKFSLPAGLMAFSTVWYLATPFLELDDALLSIILKSTKVVFTAGLVGTIYYLTDVISMYFMGLAKQSENKFDDILVPLLRKSAKFVVFTVGIIAIGNSLNLNMKSILAGMGIGGLAFALAAKDTLGNFFGSLTVLLDRPFRIGDWVVLDGKVEGTVETVGLRSTRIRTFGNTLTSVPNGMLTNIVIDNFGARDFRRFKTFASLQYDTPPEKIEAFCEGVRQLIVGHKLTRKDLFNVYLYNMSSSSLDVMIDVSWKVPDRAQELQERHRMLMDILRLGEKIGVEFAFPTQTLHLFNEDKSLHPGIDKSFNSHQYGKDAANELIAQPVTTSGHRSREDRVVNDEPNSL